MEYQRNYLSLLACLSTGAGIYIATISGLVHGCGRVPGLLRFRVVTTFALVIDQHLQPEARLSD